MAKHWTGDTPMCDICGEWDPRSPFFVDGKTHQGPWATMCPGCFMLHGVGLGKGAGQAYDATTKQALPHADLAEVKERFDDLRLFVHCKEKNADC